MKSQKELSAIIAQFNSAQRLVARVGLVIVLPIAVTWSFTARLFEEIPSAFWFAWNEARGEVSNFKAYWRQLKGRR